MFEFEKGRTLTKLWIAKWRTPDLKLHTYLFKSIENRMIAGIDFRLALLDQGRKVPPAYVLDEVDHMVQERSERC